MVAKLDSILVEKITSLRRKGYSLNDIKKETNVGYGTIYRYIKNVSIDPQYINLWLAKRKSSTYRMQKAEKLAKEKAKKSVMELSERERLLFLVALYWAEGNKGDFIITNSDPLLMKVFVQGLIKIFNIKMDEISVSIRIYDDLNQHSCKLYWSKEIGVPIDNFRSANILEGKKLGKLPYGMCRVRVKKGGDLLKYIKALQSEVVSLF